jgi:hypothetical protein
MARPPPDPALVKRALEYCRAMSPEEAAAKLTSEGHRVSQRSIYEWSKGKNGAKVAAPATPATLKPRPEPAPPPEPFQKAPPVPPHLEGVARRLWIVRGRIEAMRDALAAADATGNLSKMGTLTGHLLDLLEQEALLAPAKAATADEEERRHRATADMVLLMIEQGVQAAELKAAA